MIYFLAQVLSTYIGPLQMLQMNSDVLSYSDPSYSDILAIVTKSCGPKWPFLYIVNMHGDSDTSLK